MADEVKNVVVKVKVDGDAKALRSIAELEKAIARQQAAAARGNRAQQDATRAGQDAQKATRQQTTAVGQLNQQLQDFTIQVQGGANVITAFTQQAAQSAFVMTQYGGTVGKLAKFMAGPWGTAFFIALSVLGPFVSKLFEADEATKGLEVSEKDLANSTIALLESRARLDEALGRNTGAYEAAQEAARVLALNEMTSAAAASEAASIRLTAALNEKRIKDRLLNSGNDEAIAAGALLGLSGYGNIEKEIEAQKAATRAYKKSRDDLEILINNQTENNINRQKKADAEAERAEKAAERRHAAEQKRLKEAEESLVEYAETANAGGAALKQLADKEELINKVLLTNKLTVEGRAVAEKELLDIQKQRAEIIAKQKAEGSIYAEVSRELELYQKAMAEATDKAAAFRLLAAQITDVGLKQWLLDTADTLDEKFNPALAEANKKAKDFEDKVNSAIATAAAGGADRQKNDADIAVASAALTKAQTDPETSIETIKRLEKALNDLLVKKDQLNMSFAETTGLDIAIKAFDTLEGSIQEVINGTKSMSEAFEDMAKVVIAEITKILVKWLLLQAVKAIDGGLGDSIAGALGFAKGGVFNNGQVKKFANGGVVSSPTYFPIGQMGEAGPEAVMPLKRDSSGKLGVQAAPVNIQIVNNAGVAVQTRQEADRTVIVLEAAEQARRMITDDIKRGGASVSRAIEGTYGVSRAR